MPVLTLVTLALAAFIWWKLIHVKTSYPVSFSEFSEAMRRVQARFQNSCIQFGEATLPSIRAMTLAVQKFGEAMSSDG